MYFSVCVGVGGSGGVFEFVWVCPCGCAAVSGCVSVFLDVCRCVGVFQCVSGCLWV